MRVAVGLGMLLCDCVERLETRGAPWCAFTPNLWCRAPLHVLPRYVLTIELSPDDVVKNLRLNWPRVRGPNGCVA